jgi:hypothetical protein
MVNYAIYAERWHWTPQQVDNLTLEQDDWLLPIAEAMDKEQEYRQEKARRKAELDRKTKGS